jgi:hypothetical protein
MHHIVGLLSSTLRVNIYDFVRNAHTSPTFVNARFQEGAASGLAGLGLRWCALAGLVACRQFLELHEREHSVAFVDTHLVGVLLET